MNYEEYINSSQWFEKRKQRLKIDTYTCQACCSKENLEVHHRHYNTLFNENEETDLITFCNCCHESITSSMRERRYSLIPIELIDVFRITPFMEQKEVEKNDVEKDKIRDWKRVSPTHA